MNRWFDVLVDTRDKKSFWIRLDTFLSSPRAILFDPEERRTDNIKKERVVKNHSILLKIAVSILLPFAEMLRVFVRPFAWMAFAKVHKSLSSRVVITPLQSEDEEEPLIPSVPVVFPKPTVSEITYYQSGAGGYNFANTELTYYLSGLAYEEDRHHLPNHAIKETVPADQLKDTVLNIIKQAIVNNKRLLTLENKWCSEVAQHKDFSKIDQKWYPHGTPLMLAIKAGDDEIFDKLLEHYDSGSLLFQTKSGDNSALHLALMHFQWEMAEKMLQKAKTLGCLDQLLGLYNYVGKNPQRLYQDLCFQIRANQGNVEFKYSTFMFEHEGSMTTKTNIVGKMTAGKKMGQENKLDQEQLIQRLNESLETLKDKSLPLFEELIVGKPLRAGQNLKL